MMGRRVPPLVKPVQPKPVPLDQQIQNFLMENQKMRPQVKLMFEYGSLVLMDKLTAFMNAGFTREEAFALVLAKI